MSTKLFDVDTPIFPLAETQRFARDCLMAVGTPREHADAHATLLTEADYRGHYSHGLNRIEMYVKDIKAGTMTPQEVPKILNETAATAWVDGCNTLGAVVGNFSMDIAMKKAKECGVGWVSAKNSNHNGIEAWYTMQAMRNGLLGFSFCNTSPLLTPTRGINASLGTNPICLAAPGLNDDEFVLDMATSAAAFGKIMMKKRNKLPLPEGWAQDDKGNVTTDSDVAAEAKCLMPLGGSEMNSGYKGYGLSFLVEILSGILSGSNYGPKIRKWGVSSAGPANLGQCYIALDPKCFAPGFEERLSDIINLIKNSPPADPEKPILIPGMTERMHMKAVDEAGGVRYLPAQIEVWTALSKELDVTFMRACPCKTTKPTE